LYEIIIVKLHLRSFQSPAADDYLLVDPTFD